MKLRMTLLALAAMCCLAWAAGDAALAPQQDAAVAPAAIDNRQSTIVDGFDAITIPQMLSYQGKLTDTTGVPVPDGDYSVQFRLYTSPSGGSSFWNETQTVATKGGLFSILLGSVTPIGSMPDAGAVYLGMAVGGGAELTPRLGIAAAAYAYVSERAADADLFKGKDTTGFVRTGQANSVTGAMITDGNVSSADIRDTTVNTADIKNAAVTMAKIAQAGATAGQVVKWTGSAWAPGNDSIGAGTGDNAWVRSGSDSVLYTVHNLGIARGGANNVLYGNALYSHANLGWSCTTGMSGQNQSYCAVLSGHNNTASGSRSVVVGGGQNNASGLYASVGAGYTNAASGNYAAVGGGRDNIAGDASSDSFAVVAGGYQNRAAAKSATVCGGTGNIAGGLFAAVVGGYHDTATAAYSGALSGYGNAAGDAATDTGAVVVGGQYNRATGKFATISGGTGNDAGHVASVGGGYYNTASGNYSAIGGGAANTASGMEATVAGGGYNAARGFGSFAAGRYARANDHGSFVWSDSAASAAESVYTTNTDQFRARARGGVWFYSDGAKTHGVRLAPSGDDWISIGSYYDGGESRPVDGRALLEKVATMPVREREPAADGAGTRSIGPTAQDFHAAFGYGPEDGISRADMDGVLLAAVQALYERVEAQQAEIEALKAKLAGQR